MLVSEKMRRTVGDESPKLYAKNAMDTSGSLLKSTTTTVSSSTDQVMESSGISEAMEASGPSSVSNPGMVCSRSDFDFVNTHRQSGSDPPESPIPQPRLSVYTPPAPPPMAHSAPGPSSADLQRTDIRRSFGAKRSSQRSLNGSSGSINRVDRVRMPLSSDDVPDDRCNTLPSSIMLLARHHAARAPPPLSPARAEDSNGNLTVSPGARPRREQEPMDLGSRASSEFEQAAPSPVPTVKTMTFDARGFLVMIDKPVAEGSPCLERAHEKENVFDSEQRRHPSSSIEDESSGSDQQETYGFSDVFAKWKQVVDHQPASRSPGTPVRPGTRRAPPSGAPRMGVNSATYYSSGRGAAVAAPLLQRSHTASDGSPPIAARKCDTLNGSVDSGVMVLSEDDYHGTAGHTSLSAGNLTFAGSTHPSPLSTTRSTTILSPSADAYARSRSTPPIGDMRRPWTQRATETRRKHRERTQEALMVQQQQKCDSSNEEDSEVRSL